MNMCKALEELKQQGIEQGLAQGIEQVVVNMLKKGMNREVIKEVTGFSMDKIDTLDRKIQM